MHHPYTPLSTHTARSHVPWKNNDKDRCLPSLRCCMAWDAQAGSSAGVRGCTLRAAGPGTAGTMARQPTPGPGASPAGYHTELRSTSPPAGLTCGCLAHPLCAPISSIWAQLHFLWDMQTQTRASFPTTRGKAQLDLSPARDSRVLFLPPSCFLPLLSMSHLPCPWLLPSSHPPGSPHHTSPQARRKGALTAAELHNKQGRGSQSQHLWGSPHRGALGACRRSKGQAQRPQLREETMRARNSLIQMAESA